MEVNGLGALNLIFDLENSSDEEVEVPITMAEQPDSAMEDKKKGKVDEEKAKVAKEKKPKQVKVSQQSSHPPYFQMIKEAILALDKESGSSPHAIAKFMKEKYKDNLHKNYKKTLAYQLKSFAAKGKLIKVKGSFKLSEDAM